MGSGVRFFVHPETRTTLEPTKGAHIMHGPILHTALEDAAIKHAVELASTRIDSIFEEAAGEAKRHLQRSVSDAYRGGVRDGFVQGVIANAEGQS